MPSGIEDKGKHKWQELTGYGRWAGAENSMHPYKSLPEENSEPNIFKAKSSSDRRADPQSHGVLGMPKARPQLDRFFTPHLNSPLSLIYAPQPILLELANLNKN
ncbi:hypothetical protein [Candidatus Bealeia paramacronuclearis]|uniref:hypothetical protein n=1 Tax=Candidatus Bealeia paramacronuclearis TaxID=1921001 RepID=UPI0030D4CF37